MDTRSINKHHGMKDSEELHKNMSDCTLSSEVPLRMNQQIDRQLKVEYTLRVTGHKWETDSGAVASIGGDNVPVVALTTCHNLSNSLTFTSDKYKPGGIRVSYDIKHSADMTNGMHLNEFLAGTQGACGDTRKVDTLKFTFHSKRPDTPITMVADQSHTLRENGLYMFLCAGWVALSEFAECMQDDPRTTIESQVSAFTGPRSGVLKKTFSHNFTPLTIDVEFSDVVVSMGGVRCSTAAQLNTVLKSEMDNGYIRESMMHSMEQRSELTVGNLTVFGDNVDENCSVREKSIGSLQKRPYSMGLQEKEVVGLFQMGLMYKSDFGSVLPGLAGYFTAFAFNINGVTPEDPDVGPLLFGVYTNPRKLNGDIALRILHTIYQGPTYAAELSPYTSDVVLKISPDTVSELRNGTFKQKWHNRDVVETECIDAMHSAPNAFHHFRPDDCEGSQAGQVNLQTSMRAVFYDATRLLSMCHTEAGRTALSDWITKDCNVSIPTHKHYAFGVQVVALSTLAHLAVDLKTGIIGAICANPMMDASTWANECGHCAGYIVSKKLETRNVVLNDVYGFYDTPSNTGVLLKLPALSGPAAMGRHSNPSCNTMGVSKTFSYSDDVKSLTLPRPDYNTPSCIPSTNKDFHVLSRSISSGFPCIDVSGSEDFFVSESTTALHLCPVKGHIAVARMNGGKQNKIKMRGHANTQLASVPVETFLKSIQVDILRAYMVAGDDVRMEGFMHAKEDTVVVGEPMPTPDFYKTFYQMDDLMMNQISSEGVMLIGADASDLLNNPCCPTTRITVEKVSLPVLTDAENETYRNQMLMQWAETRSPTMGSVALSQMLSTWHPATISSTYAPEDNTKGIMRCNIAISGENADKLYTDLSLEGELFQNVSVYEHGVVSDRRVMRIGMNTTVVSHAVRTRHFKDGSQ